MMIQTQPNFYEHVQTSKVKSNLSLQTSVTDNSLTI